MSSETEKKIKERIAELRKGKRKLEPAQFMTAAALAIETHVKLKKRMLERGLRAARTNCPVKGCGGQIHATLNGRKNHLHWKCDACGLAMVE